MSSLLVSTFEVLLKPIAPVNASAARRVAEGYFLTISNVTPSQLRFFVRFRIPRVAPPAGADPNTRIFVSAPPNRNHDLTFDITGGPAAAVAIPPGGPGFGQTFFGQLVEEPAAAIAPTQRVFRTPANANLALDGGETGILTLSPAFTLLTQAGTPLPTLEVRGYCEIVRETIAPATVVVSADIRGTIIPPTVVGQPTDFDQISYSLPIASGAALNTF
jgi:hypothetical protein